MGTKGREAQLQRTDYSPTAQALQNSSSRDLGMHAVESNPKARRSFVAIETSSYSGATLLAFLLSAHPEIVSIGEMNGVIPTEDIETYMCSCGKRIRVCEFWQTVRCAMEQRGFTFDVAHFDTEFVMGGPHLAQKLRAGSFRSAKVDALRDHFFLTLPGARTRLKRQIARNIAFIDAVLEVTNKRVFVDTSKNHLRAKHLAKYGALDVRAIHLVRDPRGVFASRLRRSANLDARDAARQWVRLHERLERMFNTLPTMQVTRVRYEDVCRAPKEVLAQLCEFCGVEGDLHSSDLRGLQHHIVGNPMRLTNYAEIQFDESWRTRLTRAQMDQIMRVAGGLAARCGYV